MVLKPKIGIEFGGKNNLGKVRREYLKGGLKYDDLARDPIVQFERWMKQAMDARIQDPSAMTLATVDENGQPSQRIVLLKHVDKEGFVFYTNYESRKAKEIEENSKVSLHFPWHVLERQVKICGYAERVETSDSLSYFLSRPLESQLAAWASPQSKSVNSRALLMQQFNAMKDKFSKGEVPLPDFWGGYRIIPTEIEFWQGGANRLHDRFEYTLEYDGEWSIERLAP